MVNFLVHCRVAAKMVKGISPGDERSLTRQLEKLRRQRKVVTIVLAGTTFVVGTIIAAGGVLLKLFGPPSIGDICFHFVTHAIHVKPIASKAIAGAGAFAVDQVWEKTTKLPSSVQGAITAPFIGALKAEATAALCRSLSSHEHLIEQQIRSGSRSPIYSEIDMSDPLARIAQDRGCFNILRI